MWIRTSGQTRRLMCTGQKYRPLWVKMTSLHKVMRWKEGHTHSLTHQCLVVVVAVPVCFFPNYPGLGSPHSPSVPVCLMRVFEGVWSATGYRDVKSPRCYTKSITYQRLIQKNHTMEQARLIAPWIINNHSIRMMIQA